MTDTAELLDYLTDDERGELHTLAMKDKPLWLPHPANKPQQMAFASQADIIGFGGSAGGGKTDLGIGKALIQHQRSICFRKNGTEHTSFIDRLEQILGTRDGFNSQTGIWRLAIGNRKLQLELGSVPNPGDELKYRGRPHDLKWFDEVSEWQEAPVRFLLGWLRTTIKDQRCQALLTFNPPTTAEGRWVVDFFAPWLDDTYPLPAEPGELRWFITVDSKDIPVPNADPIELPNGEIVQPLSRTFIPSRVTDNPYLMNTGYVTMLQALPEPLRSQMLYGDFKAGMKDDPWQVIPTSWVDAAMARWARPAVKAPMDSMGLDVGRGGDPNVVARRHGQWYDELEPLDGAITGPEVAGHTIALRKDSAVVHVDVIGVGASPYDFLRQNDIQAIGVNVAEGSTRTDKSGRLRFYNLRSDLWWGLRESLDPNSNSGIALPPDKRLRIELCAPKWKLRGMRILVESREEIIERIGHSPDRASALILASIDTPKIVDVRRAHNATARDYDPYVKRDYDPYARP